MGRKSTKENMNIYQTSRENMNFTCETAAEQMGFISSDRIEKIEYEKTLPHPEEVLAMANCYKNPSLCNYFCLSFLIFSKSRKSWNEWLPQLIL